ncbi:MAG TPA: carboxypeptidase-like regulatory domain-containing protein [Terriglobales bacterium]|nr:carboxypeptidase-like regulatory domain-containing protein [Terriglobales bacterium]
MTIMAFCRSGFTMRSRSMRLALFLMFVVCLGGVLSTRAQSTATGTVVGTVSDQSGAVVGSAAVILTDTATNTSQTTTTNETGRYIFVNVNPGTYNISINKTGFTPMKATDVSVRVGTATTVNGTLQVGGATVEVEVKAASTELQTMNATVGNTITGIALDSLPSLNRDVSTFIELQPGVSPDGSVAGTAVDQSSFMLDGGNNTNDMDGSMSVYTTTFAGDPTGGISNQSNAVAAGPTGVVPTPADSVEEFKVNTANQTADFNSSSGAQVQVVTRRGTNDWHGSAYEYYLDNNFSANTWENNATGTALPNWHRSRFGARAGGPILPKMLGGKTYFFANYEGYRWPNSSSVERAVPSAGMRLGLLTFGGITYNLNPTPVTNDGVTYPGSNLDPRGIGIDPLIEQMWNKYMPLSNESGCGLARCDGANVQGFKANIAIPQTSNFGVVRLDHDFGDKWHFMSSYRYFKLSTATADEVDIGGFFKGDQLGVPASQSTAPQLPWYLVAGVTTNISSNTTNDFRYSFLRNWWAWSRAGDVVQFPGLGGALEPFGENRNQVLAPYNVNTQQTRTRFWDGHDQMLRDDVSMLKGNHLFQLGGVYQHNFNWHQRTDNGGGINYQPVYQLGTTAGAGIGGIPTPAGLSSKQATNFGRDYAAMLGIVSISQQAYTRSGANLALNPPLTPAFDQSTIPYYNVYFSDTWHMKPTFTLTYGLGWTLEMPPVEKNGKQVELVDQANRLIDVQAYMHSREAAALQGQVYNPIVGFNLVGNTENGRKYPYDPFYGSFSPRIAAAWNPRASGGMVGSLLGNGNTVFRVGYGRIYGRLNGVDLVLVPLLGTGLIQPVQCIGALRNGGCAGSTTGTDPTNAFRVGVDGLVAPIPAATPTLPQPLFPGINGIAAGAGQALDPHFRPNFVDSLDFTIQRQLSRNITMELGYVGRWIHHEYQPININAVPYMMTLGGQRFDKAYANLVLQYCGGIAGLAGGGCALNTAAVVPQPFFEASLAGTGYCTGYSSCTAAVVANEGGPLGNLANQGVWSLWSDLDSSGFNFPRSMLNTPIPGSPNGVNGQLTSGVGVNASVGYGNYNAGFVSIKMSDWRGLSMQSNFTWSKALGTGTVVQATSSDTPPDPFNLRTGYGLQGFDRKFVYNLFFVYQPPFYKGQPGVVGRLLGGWTFAPIFAAGTGLPMTLGTINGGGQAFGEGDSVNFLGYGNSENAIPIGPIPGSSVHRNVLGSNGVGTSGLGINLWADPSAVYNSIRQPILGLDTRDGGFGVLRGLRYWNLDLSVKKNFKITERVNFEFQTVFANILNHAQLLDPAFDYLDTSNPASFGVSPGQTLLPNLIFITPRTMEFGFRLNF